MTQIVVKVMSAYDRIKKNRDAKRAMARSAKALVACADCGEADPTVLHFVEQGGFRRQGIGKAISRNVTTQALQEIMAQSEVVCSNDRQKREARALRSEIEETQEQVRKNKAETARLYAEVSREMGVADPHDQLTN